MQLIPGMELVPLLQLAWLNGWILVVILIIVEGILVLSFPKEKRGRPFEYDHSRWGKGHRIIFIIGKTFSLICMILIIFTPLKIGSPAFLLGIIIYTIGLAGFITALITFRNTPIDQPVNRGIYRFSRNPQALTLLITIGGACLAIGSWVALLILLLSALLNRVRLLEEEKDCLERYGDAYRNYMKQVPRYLLVKTKIKEE